MKTLLKSDRIALRTMDHTEHIFMLALFKLEKQTPAVGMLLRGPCQTSLAPTT